MLNLPRFISFLLYKSLIMLINTNAHRNSCRQKHVPGECFHHCLMDSYMFASASEIILVRVELVAYFCKQHTWKKHTIQTLEKVFKIFKRPIVLQVSIYFKASIRCGLAPGFVNYKKGALDSQPQVIKFTSC